MPRAVASVALTPRKDLRLPSARTLARFLASTQKAVRLKGQVTVLLTTDAAMRKLNRRFRGKNKATDVLSFPSAQNLLQNAKPAERVAGDLAISVPTALRQAAEQGHSLSTEIKVLILHGLLHLAGYDHDIDNGKMARREGRLRARLGLPPGLIERAVVPNKPVLKGHGFSRAAESQKKAAALAAQGMQVVEEAVHQVLKPDIPIDEVSARLASRPFEATKLPGKPRIATRRGRNS